MHYELSHDSIARQVYTKAGAEAQARRKVERYIHEHYLDWQQRGVRLTQDDLDYIGPYLGLVTNSEEEMEFVRQGKRYLVMQRRRRLLLMTLVATAFALVAVWALWHERQAEKRERQSRSMRVGLAAEHAMHEGYPAVAYRLAQQTLEWNNDENAKRIAQSVLEEIKANPLVRDFVHQDSIVSIQFAGDGSYLLTASRDGDLRLSDLYGKVLAQLRLPDGLLWATFLAGDQAVIALDSAGKLQLWEAGTNQLIPIAFDAKIERARLSADRQLLLSSTENQVVVWSMEDLSKANLRLEHPAPVTAMTVALLDSTWSVITADANDSIYYWNAKGENTFKYRNYLSLPVTDITVNQGGDRVVFATEAGDFMQSVQGDSLTSQTEILFQAYQPTNTHFSRATDPQRMASISRDSNLVFVWNLTWPNSDIDIQWSPKGQAQFAAISADSSRLLVSSTTNEMVFYLLKGSVIEQNEEVFRFYNRTLWGVFAPNESHFLSSAGGNVALLWKLDPKYVNLKLQSDLTKLQQYYDVRLARLSPEERAFYQLD